MHHPAPETQSPHTTGQVVRKKGPGNPIAQQMEEDAAICPCDKEGQLYTQLY